MKQKTIFTITLIIFYQFGFGQSEMIQSEIEKVKLEWKLEEGDTIMYKTVMQNVENEIDGNSPFQKLIEDSEFVEKLQKQMDNTNLITFLTNSKSFEEVIEIELIGREIKKTNSTNDDEMDFMSSMMKGTLLRGAVKKSGEVFSFWLKRAQLNLVSMFFELPGKPISIGEIWELKNLSLIGNDQNFKCEEAERTNQVKLVELLKTDTETIAVLKYTIREYVSGTFGMNNPFEIFASKNEDADQFSNELTKTRPVIIDYSFNATAKFSITKGKWVSFNGIVSTKSLGFMGNNSSKQNYALEEIK